MSDPIFAFDRSGTVVRLPPGEVTIGSGASCTIQIEGDGVESLQAVVLIDATSAVLQSRGVDADVRVNGMPSRVGELTAGDRLRFGDFELTLDVSAEGQSLAGPAGTYELKSGENAVGRSPDGAVVLNDPSVSREHALVVVLPGLRVLVRDLRSSNGTFVNDRRLGEVGLSTGDVVEIGSEKLVFVETRLPPGVAGAPGPSDPAALEFRLLVGTELQPLEPGVVAIGRASDCDIRVKDSEVSGRHAEFTVGSHEVRLRDLGSSNGTKVNGVPIKAEVVLQDRDTVIIGTTKILFMAPSSAADLEKTVLSGSIPGLGKTVVSGASGPAGSVAPPPGVDAGLALLDLSAGASETEIQQKFKERFSEYQIRLTNAPTPDLKNKYQQKLDELQSARDELLSPSPGEGMDLPSAEPVRRAAGRESESPIEVSKIAPPPPAEPAGKAAAKSDPPSSSGKLPSSARTMLMVSASLVLLTIVLAFFGRKAGAVADAVQAELAAKQASITAMSERIPQTDQAIASLEEGKVALLENAEFKICNLSSRSLWVVWVHSTYVDESGRFLSFDSAFNNYQSWEVPAGGTTKFNLVKDDRVVWDGSTIFFSVLMQYGGKEIFRSGAWSAIGSECYNLALDP